MMVSFAHRGKKKKRVRYQKKGKGKHSPTPCTPKGRKGGQRSSLYLVVEKGGKGERGKRRVHIFLTLISIRGGGGPPPKKRGKRSSSL